MKVFCLFFLVVFISLSEIRLHAQSIGCDSIQIVHVEMDSVDTGVLHLHVWISGSGLYLNYPQIPWIMNAAGDTIGTGELSYYIHPGGIEQIYSVRTQLFEVPETFRAYFTASEGFCELQYVHTNRFPDGN